jgi:hypothetical protein
MMGYNFYVHSSHAAAVQSVFATVRPVRAADRDEVPEAKP